MRIHVVLSLILFSCLYKETAAQEKDTLYIEGQAAIWGKLKNIQLGIVTFDANQLGDITVKLVKLNAIKATSYLFRIETIDKELYYCKLYPGRSKKQIRFVSGGMDREIPIENIISLSYFQKNFWQRLDGNISFGFDYTRSSGIGRLNADASATYITRRIEVALSGSTIITFAGDSSQREPENMGLSGTYYFGNAWLATPLFNYQRNLELGIQRRFQQALGIGNKIVLKPHLQTAIVAAFAINEETNTNDSRSKTLMEVPVMVLFNLFNYKKTTTKLSVKQAVYFGLNQGGRVRLDGEINLSWEIIQHLLLSLRFTNNFDSRPPNLTGKTLDFSTVFSIGYQF
jgi:hypothetical protein